MNRPVAVLALLAISALLVGCRPNQNDVNAEYNDWNGGYCKDDGSRLEYIEAGSKYHYRCSTCGKEYTFSKLMRYEDRQ